MGERRVEAFGGDADLLAGEPERRVAQQRPGDQARLGQHLEPVADAQHEAPVGREARHRPHDRAEPGDDPCPDIVAVGEPTRQDDRGSTVEGRLLMPERDRVGTGQGEGVERVTVAIASGEDDHADPHAHRQRLPGRRRR